MEWGLNCEVGKRELGWLLGIRLFASCAVQPGCPSTCRGLWWGLLGAG